MRKILWPTALLAALVVASPGWADGMAMPMSHRHAAPVSAADRANAEAMRVMMRDMDVKPSGDPDKDFARMMLAHHRGAIAMAKVELSYGHDPDMRALAEEIVKAQEAEITRMQGWLDKH